MQDAKNEWDFNHPFWSEFKEEDVMLVIGRRPGEYVMIGEDIKVMVVKSENGDLRLAIEAPRDIVITRGEVFETKKIAK